MTYYYGWICPNCGRACTPSTPYCCVKQATTTATTTVNNQSDDEDLSNYVD